MTRAEGYKLIGAYEMDTQVLDDDRRAALAVLPARPVLEHSGRGGDMSMCARRPISASMSRLGVFLVCVSMPSSIGHFGQTRNTRVEMTEVAYLSCTVLGMTTNKPASDTWVSPGDAAAILGVSQRTLSRLADRGEVRAIRPAGGHRRYSEESLEALLARAANWSRS